MGNFGMVARCVCASLLAVVLVSGSASQKIELATAPSKAEATDALRLAYASYAAVRDETSQIVVSFRGTVNDADATTSALNNLADMAVPLAPLSTRLGSARAHFGWEGQWNRLRPGLVAVLRGLRIQRPRHKLLLTGHSS